MNLLTEAKRLKELAKLATHKGEWGCTSLGDPSGGWVNVYDDKTDDAICVNTGGNYGDGQWIASANPTTIAAMCEFIEDTMEVLEFYAEPATEDGNLAVMDSGEIHEIPDDGETIPVGTKARAILAKYGGEK